MKYSILENMGLHQASMMPLLHQLILVLRKGGKREVLPHHMLGSMQGEETMRDFNFTRDGLC